MVTFEITKFNPIFVKDWQLFCGLNSCYFKLWKKMEEEACVPQLSEVMGLWKNCLLVPKLVIGKLELLCFYAAMLT